MHDLDVAPDVEFSRPLELFERTRGQNPDGALSLQHTLEHFLVGAESQKFGAKLKLFAGHAGFRKDPGGGKPPAEGFVRSRGEAFVAKREKIGVFVVPVLL